MTGGVGHRADNIPGAGKYVRETRETFARENREHELAGREVRQPRIESRELLRLAREHDRIGGREQRHEIRRSGDAGARRERDGGAIAAVGTGEIAGSANALGEEAVDFNSFGI